jgi:hypothetical protein
MQRYLYLFLLFLASACESPDELEARLMSVAAERCKAYGFNPQSDLFAQCMQTERQQMTQQQIAASAALMNQANQMRQPAIRPVVPISCTTVQQGVFANTSCQ